MKYKNVALADWMAIGLKTKDLIESQMTYLYQEGKQLKACAIGCALIGRYGVRRALEFHQQAYSHPSFNSGFELIFSAALDIEIPVFRAITRMHSVVDPSRNTKRIQELLRTDGITV